MHFLPKKESVTTVAHKTIIALSRTTLSEHPVFVFLQQSVYKFLIHLLTLTLIISRQTMFILTSYHLTQRLHKECD